MGVNKNIKYHTIPRWLKSRLKGTSYILHGMLVNCPWLDHWGYDKETKEFISEPYDLSMDKLELLVEFCRKTGTTFTISAQSSWYPGKTLRVTITDKTKHQ